MSEVMNKKIKKLRFKNEHELHILLCEIYNSIVAQVGTLSPSLGGWGINISEFN